MTTWASTHIGAPLTIDEPATSPTRLELAHAGAPALGAPRPATSRQQREELEAQLLHPGATRASGSGNRVRPEPADPHRTCFERDRDRILHSPALRRLAGKTQVFIFPDDHQRTRLTHALEVAQVAVSIARATGLNPALTEAIALGHDCGHGPGGHASEEALGIYLSDGFDHAPWGAHVVLEPLNLCAETTDGIANHSWSRPAPSTPEGEVVAWADRIAYVCHDFEDAVAAGVVEIGDLPPEVTAVAGHRRSGQITTFVDALVATMSAHGVVAMPAEQAAALSAFRRFNYETIYLRPDSVRQRDAVIDVLRAVVEHTIARPQLLPADRVAADGDVVRAAVRWVADMTDAYACRIAVEHLGWPLERLPVGMRAPAL